MPPNKKIFKMIIVIISAMKRVKIERTLTVVDVLVPSFFFYQIRAI